MPSRSRTTTRTATAPVEESSEAEEPQESASRLKFDEALSWRAGKPIALADLLRRLEALSIELRDLEQEEDDRDAFTRVAKELAASNLLSHKDKGVRAWTACCLVDILRLCAPDAPFTAQQLKVSVQHLYIYTKLHLTMSRTFSGFSLYPSFLRCPIRPMHTIISTSMLPNLLHKSRA